MIRGVLRAQLGASAVGVVRPAIRYAPRAAAPWVILLLTMCSAGGARGADALTSREARQDAASLIPYDKLDPATRAKISAVVDRRCIFRRLPVEVEPCDPEMYQFLLRHPEVVVNIWEAMGISNVQIERINGRSFHAVDGSGTRCRVETVYRDDKTHVIYAEGEYQGPIFKRKLSARCVLILTSDYTLSRDGRYYISNRLDAFVKIKQLGVELVAKTVHPLVGNVADHNFRETVAFVGRLSEVAEQKPQGVAKLASRLNDVDEDTRSQFVLLTYQVAERAARRAASAQKRMTSTSNGRPQINVQASGAVLVQDVAP